MDFSELFIYEPETGKLINRIDRNPRAKAGADAGIKNDSGYIVTRINGKNHRAHRIIWEMHNGQIPAGYEIDHINRNRSDNRIQNLRLATRQEQGLNLSQRNSKSGVTGVVFCKKDKRWQAQIGVNGKHIYLGQFKDFCDAVSARKSAELKYGFRRW